MARKPLDSSALPAILTLASVVDFGALLPRAKEYDCPKCGKAKLQGTTLRYCLRCAYTERVK